MAYNARDIKIEERERIEKALTEFHRTGDLYEFYKEMKKIILKEDEVIG